ncbi:MAG: mandelate racemase [Nocardiopsaceae bacterium]|nr:mandelate racemase [Nocardiopsaceae bacterium]
MQAAPALPVRGTDARAYRIPTEVPEADGTLSWTDTTLVVVRVDAGETTGLGYTYADAACADFIERVLAAVIAGRDALDVPAAWAAMRSAVRNQGRPGLAGCAISAVETALWDAAARAHGSALCRLFGRAHQSVPVYGSGGFTTYDPRQSEAQLRRWVEELGVGAVKIKIGEDRGTAVRRDLERVARARSTVGEDVAVFVDANGGYGTKQAVRVGAELDGLGVSWFEEPVSSDDLDGLCRVRDRVGADVAAGEYGYDLPYFADMLAAGAVDCLQVDVTRCGGFSAWFRACAVAAAANMDVSAHCAQNLSAHAAAATPNTRHLEWFRDHERIEETFFAGALRVTDGAVRPDISAPGHGMEFKDADAAEFRVA